MAFRNITQPTITEYLDQLDSDKHKLVTFLNNRGFPSSDNQTFTILIPKLDFLPSGNIDVEEYRLKFGYSSWTTVDTTRFIFNNCTSHLQMFYNNTNLTTLPSNIVTSKSTSTKQMCNGCSSLTSISQQDTSNVTDMQAMFNDCTNLANIPQFNTIRVTNMYQMFQGCRNLTDTSLNNILLMCINSNLPETSAHTLYYLGFRSSTYAASRIQALPAYNDFIAAGWTIGY